MGHGRKRLDQHSEVARNLILSLLRSRVALLSDQNYDPIGIQNYLGPPLRLRYFKSHSHHLILAVPAR